MLLDRFSCSSGYKLVDIVVVGLQVDQGIQVNREVPWVPLVLYIRGHRGIHDIQEVRVVPCILAVQEVLEWGKERGTGLVVAAVEEAEEVAEKGHSTIVSRLEHTWQHIQNHRDQRYASLRFLSIEQEVDSGEISTQRSFKVKSLLSVQVRVSNEKVLIGNFLILNWLVKELN